MENELNSIDPEILVGLDIGTTKIACFVGQRNEHGKIEILGYGKSESVGVSRGVVSNIDRTVQSIKAAVKAAEEDSGVEIKLVNVGIAGQHIKSLQHRGMITRENTEDEISQSNINELVDDMSKLVMPPGSQILHVLPQEFTVDSEPGIKDPVGMAGVRLEANFHIITGDIAAAKNIVKCVSKAGLELDKLVLEPLASSSSVLTEEEKEAGVALIDIGGGTTDIAIFQDGIIRHTAVIPFGGKAISQDISNGCTIMAKHAEKLKCKFGSALSQEMKENELVCIPGLQGRPPKEISLKNLASIIEARTQEIIEHVHYEIKASGFGEQLIGGIVVTGGGSQLRHITQLFQYVTGLDCRVGYPNEHLHEPPSDTNIPSFSTGVGLVIRGYEDQRLTDSKDPLRKKKEKRNGFMDKFLNNIKTWFEEEQDY
ncbi:MAG: cell division protein FtsA [Crocinitomicaceae bacterium]|nr:cell division protein FtsA [Crocinitomicaceae bacterium]|tara:strand:+ start:1193 stop:2473 length:1281 start_codon:yes stop_codon:yes gene_type:complete